MGRPAKVVPLRNRELLDALQWLEGAVEGTHRAVGVRTSGDSDYYVRTFENCTLRAEVMIHGVCEFRRAIKVVHESLSKNGASV